jgi:taurine dioxygenase
VRQHDEPLGTALDEAGESALNLFVMRDDCTGIEGIGPDEAEALIAALADHIVKPAFVYRHQWRPGDVLMWDNCMVQHRAIQDYDMPQRRLMHRTTMGGAVPA